MKTITAIPAYGRDYSSKAKVLEAWETGKDFLMLTIRSNNCYFSKADLEELKKEGYTAIQFRYRKLQNTFILEITK